MDKAARYHELARASTRAPITRRSFMEVVAGAAFLTGFRSSGTAAATRRQLVYALSSFPAHLRPWENVGSAAAAVKTAIYRGLLGYDGVGALRGEIAHEWGFVTDRELRFKLRTDARFHDGTAITPDDVLHSLGAIRQARTSFLHAEFQNIERMDLPDRNTIALHLKLPNFLLPNLLASSNAAIVSHRSTEKEAIGSGPFKVIEIERGNDVRVARSPGFYRRSERPVEEIHFRVYADDALKMAALRAGDVDIVEYVPWESMDALARSDEFSLDGTTGPFMYLVFNVKSGPLADARVRRAIGFALNRTDIVSVAFSGKGEELNGLPIPPGSEFRDAAPEHEWRYDPSRARHLLAEAGYANGFATSLLATAQYGFHQSCAEVIKANLAEVGIAVELSLPDFATRVQRGSSGQYQIGLHGSAGDYNDPDALAPFMSSKSPPLLRSFGFESGRIDGLLERGRQARDRDARAGIYRDLKAAHFTEVPFVGIAWRQQAFAMRRDVRNFRNLPGFLSFLSNYSLDEVEIG